MKPPISYIEICGLLSSSGEVGFQFLRNFVYSRVWWFFKSIRCVVMSDNADTLVGKNDGKQQMLVVLSYH